MHKLLDRQLRKIYGPQGAPPELAPLLGAVDAAYVQADEERARLERSLELTSDELVSRFQRLEDSEAGFRMLVDHAPWGIVVHQKRIIVYANDSVAKLLGCSGPQEVVGQHIMELWHPDDHEDVNRRIASGALGERHPRAMIRRDGQKRLTEVSALQTTFRGQPSLLIIIDDVHERRAMEDQLRMNERLAALGRLAAGVAHEINNPAAAIKGNLSFLEEELPKHEVPPDTICALRESMECVERIAKIVEQMKLSTRSATTELNTHPVNLREAVEFALRMLAGPLDGADIQVDVPEELTVQAEEVFVGQILQSLLNNAVQATPPGERPHITVSAHRDADQVQFEVADSGPGMDQATQARIFEPFFTTKPVGQGTGLGLSVASGLLVTLGGSISVQSAPDAGARFIVRLPAGGEETSSAAADPAQRTPSSRLPLLLVVDDDPLVGSGLRRQLLGEFDVESANGVESALIAVQRRAPEIILCDVVMPDGGARRLMEELGRLQPALADRVILITGGVTTEALQTFVKLTSRPVLAKPLSRTRLTAAVRMVDAAAKAG